MAGAAGEVLTVQLGHYANCAGAHWWNLQEALLSQRSDRWNSEISSDVIFRRGMTLHGVETYTPRLIVLDVKGSPRSVREEGCLYEDRETRHDTPAWTGSVSVHREEQCGMQEVRGMNEGDAQLERDCDGRTEAGRGQSAPTNSKKTREAESEGVWSDYLRTQLHPKSLCILTPHSQGGGTEGLESFSQGEELFRASSQLDEVEDRLHFFTEECDYLQGFQILCDLHSGFSGAGAKVAEILHDEYPGRGILSFATCPVPAGERSLHKAMYQLMNCILALPPLASHSSILCPLSVNSSLGRRPGLPAAFPDLLYDASRQYESSAILALALDTITSPYRMSSPGMSMTHLAESINFSGRKVVAASCSVPFPIRSSALLPDALLPLLGSAPWRSVSACAEEGAVFSQSVVMRGIPRERQSCRLLPGTREQSPLHTCGSGEEVLQRYLSTVYPRTASFSHLLQTPTSLGPTFPQFFSPYVTKDGFTGEQPRPQAAAVGGVPVMAAVQASSALCQSLRSLCDQVTQQDIRRWVNVEAAGVEQEDFMESVSALRSLADCYKTRDNETDDDSE